MGLVIHDIKLRYYNYKLKKVISILSKFILQKVTYKH